MASLRSLRLVGLCIILGLTSLIAVRSFSEPDTIEPEGDEVATTSFAGGDASEFTSWDRGGHPSWDGGPGDGFGAADMQVRVSVCSVCSTRWRLLDTPFTNRTDRRHVTFLCADRTNTMSLVVRR